MVALVTDKDMTTHHFGAAVGDVLNGPLMRGWHPLSESVPVRRPVGSENVRYDRHDLLKIS